MGVWGGTLQGGPSSVGFPSPIPPLHPPHPQVGAALVRTLLPTRSRWWRSLMGGRPSSTCSPSHRERSFRGYSKLRTHTAIGTYGSSMPRSIGPSYGRCVSLISSNPCAPLRPPRQARTLGAPDAALFKLRCRLSPAKPESYQLRILEYTR